MGLTVQSERNLFLRIFPLWLILTSMPILAYGIGLALSKSGYSIPNELLFLVWYVGAPIGSAYFSLHEIAAIGFSIAVVALGFFFRALQLQDEPSMGLCYI